jgi:hypothetical protein
MEPEDSLRRLHISYINNNNMYDCLIMGRAIIIESKIKDSKFLNCYVGQY